MHLAKFEHENPASEEPRSHTAIKLRTNELSDDLDMVHLQTNHDQFHNKSAVCTALCVFKS